MSARQRLTFAGIAVLIAVVAVVVIAAAGGSDDGSEPSNRNTLTEDATAPPTATPQADATRQPEATKAPEPKVPTVVVEDGQPVGGVKEVEATQGDQVRFRVVSDVADEIHVHGYDLMKDVSAGGQVTFSFKATITGIFEAELEDRGVQVLSLRVDPK